MQSSAESAEFRTVLYPQRGYPFLLTLTARYSLDADGLRIDVSARNDGDRDAPYGVSMHPWFVTVPEPLASWTLTVPAERVLTTDGRLLPTGSEPVTGALDFRRGRLLGDTALDHAFADVIFDGDDLASAVLVSETGAGVEVSWDRRCQWVQVCTGDEVGPALSRRAVAIEPMTCPPDAFRSGAGLVRLPPGQAHEVSWRIRSLG